VPEALITLAVLAAVGVYVWLLLRPAAPDAPKDKDVPVLKERPAPIVAPHVLDEARAPGLKLHWPGPPGAIEYADGTKQDREGYLLSVYTAADLKKRPEIELVAGPIDPADCPVLVQIAYSPFDQTGEPISVQRVADGKALWRSAVWFPLIWGAYVSPDGEKAILTPSLQHAQRIDEANWRKSILAEAGHMKPERLEKLTDEQLHLLGYTRLKKGSGLRGKVTRPEGAIGGATVRLFAGPYEIGQLLAGTPVYRATVDAKGNYEVAVDPGIYAVVIHVAGQDYRNQFGRDTVEIGKDTWVEHPIKSPR
jgi:hypothetical protein